MQENLGLKKITDVLDNAVEYIEIMRGKKDSDSIPIQLKQYIWEYFRNVDLNKEMLEGLALFLVDETYRMSTRLGLADKYTYAFFSNTMSKLWDSIQGRGVDTFYILDNTLSEERFWLAYNIFRLSGFCAVTSYFDTSDNKALKTKEERTVHIVLDPPQFYEFCSVEAVEAQIINYMKPIQNIVYIEKDARVNYLDKVVEIAKNSNYLCILRNADPSDKKVEVIRSNFIHKNK